METVDRVRRTRNFRGHSREQETDLVELGERVARGLKSESGDLAERIVARRAFEANPLRFDLGRRFWWMR